MKDSKRFTLNSNDISRVAKNALIFLAPALIIAITTLQTGGTFNEAFVALKVWALSTALDLLRKWQAGK